MLKPTPRQARLPFQSKEEALADMYERLVRIESKLTKLLLKAGLDEHGNPPRKSRPLPPTD